MDRITLKERDDAAITYRGGRRLRGEVLLVEDNAIIAMDVEDMLHELGAERVWMAANVEDAMDIVSRRRLSFALLDVNLTTGTSERVARALQAEGVPFAFATGYDRNAALSRAMPDVPVVTKPYARGDVRAALAG